MSKKHRKNLNAEPAGEINSSVKLFIGDALDNEPAPNASEEPQQEKRSAVKLPQVIATVLGVLMVLFSTVGVVATVRYINRQIEAQKDKTALIAELSSLILPFSASDAPTFEKVSELSSDVLVSVACWDVILNPTSSHIAEEGVYTVSYLDIDARINKIFGSGLSYNHLTVGDEELMFSYNEETKMYSIPANPRYMSYYPTVEELTEFDGGYYLTVSYRLPVAQWIEGDRAVEKYMIYSVKETDRRYTVYAVELGKVITGSEL